MTLKAAALAAALAGLSLAGAPAVAQPSGPSTSGRVRLEVTGCAAVPSESVRRVLSVEIGDLLLEPDDRDPRPADGLIIRCAGNLASVEAIGGGEPPIERLLPLDDFPGDAAPRALALLGVELLAARSAAVRERIMSRQARPPAPPVETAAVRPPSPTPPPAARDVRLGLTGVWRTFSAGNAASAFGGRVEGSATARRFGLATADLEIAAAHKEVDTVGQTTAWLMSAGATFGMLAGSHRWRAALGAGGRIGLLRESGSSADPAHVTTATFLRPWGGPMLRATLSGILGRAGLTMSAEAGWSLSSIDEMGGGVSAIGVGRAWLALSIGAELHIW